MQDDSRVPIIVGVGTASQRDGVLEPVGLMTEALRRAEGDAGSAGLLARADAIWCPQGSWAYRNAPGTVAAAIGATGSRTTLAQLGILQQTLFRRAYEAIVAGEIEIGLIVGGEAKFRALQAQIAGTDLPPQTDVDSDPDEVVAPDGRIVSAAEIAAGLTDAVGQYALLENAQRAVHGWTIGEHRDVIARQWASMNEIAGGYDEAWNPAPMSAETISEPGPRNRPLAFPYNKWHNSQWNVDQAAGFIVCSVATARELGVAEDRWVYPHASTESNQMVPVTERARPAACPGVRIAGGRAFELAGTTAAAIDHVDLYSCFPVAVRVQIAELGLAPERPVTITGGMAFGGGPLNNYVLQSTAAMVRRLRADPGTLGLVTAISGMITKQGYGIYGTDAPAEGFRSADATDEVAAATETVEVREAHTGDVEVVTYTVRYDADGPEHVVAVGDVGDGTRVVVTGHDRALAQSWTTTDPIGSTVKVEGTSIVS